MAPPTIEVRSKEPAGFGCRLNQAGLRNRRPWIHLATSCTSTARPPEHLLLREETTAIARGLRLSNAGGLWPIARRFRYSGPCDLFSCTQTQEDFAFRLTSPGPRTRPNM